MDDTFIAELQKQIAEADAEANRIMAQLTPVQRKRADLQTALRVYCELTGQRPAPAKTVEIAATATAAEEAKPPQRPSAEKKDLIRRLLGFGESTGKTPATVFKQLVQQNVKDIPITQVRTILWRMENKKQGVASKDGHYFLCGEDQPALDMGA
jgi:hypothetical protein